jgi:WD40 repeat protein
VVKDHDRLRIHNPIYAQVFDRHWLARVLAERRPYRESLQAWLATDRQDESRLLRGKALQEAAAWSQGKKLNDFDRDFLAASQRLENKLQKDRKVRKWLLGTTVLVSVVAFCSTFFFLAAADNAHRDRVRALVNSSKAHRQAGENRESLLDGISAAQLSQQIRGGQEKPAALANLRDLLRKLKADRGAKSVDSAFRFKDVVFSTDSQKILGVNADGQISAWQTDGTSLPNVEIISEKRLLSLDFSPDGSNVATTNGNKTISIWRSSDGQLVKTFDGDGQRWQHVSYSPNGQMIAASSAGDIKLWGLDGKMIAQLSGHQNQITGLSFSPNGQLLVSSSRDGTVKLWNMSGRNIKTWEGHLGAVATVAFAPNSRLVASGGGDRMIKLWDVEGKLLRSIEAHQQKITVLAFHPDGTMVASASTDRTIKLWRLDGTLVKTFKGHKDVVNKAIFSPDGRKLVSASLDGALQLWDLQEDAPRTIQQAPPLASEFRVEAPETNGSNDSQRLNNENGQIPKAIEAGCQELSEYQSNNDLSPEGERVCEGIVGNKKNR